MTTELSAGVYFQEEQPRVRQIQGVSTSVAAFVGVTERGRIGVAVRSTSWSEWVKEFGGFVSYSDLPQSVYMAFVGGAREVITVRIAHYTDINNGNSYTATKASGSLSNSGAGSVKAQIYSGAKAPFALSPGQTLILQKNGVVQPTLTFTGTRAINTSSNTENQDMSGGKSLTLRFDNGNNQDVSFVDGDFAVPGAATAEEVAHVINRQVTGGRAYDNGSGAVSIESDTLGSNSRVEIISGDANTAWSWSASVVGTGNVENIGQVQISEVKTLLETVVSGISVSDDGLGRLLIEHDEAGSTKTLQVDSSSTADTPMLLDNDVHTGLDQQATKGAKTSTNSAPFSLSNGDTLDIELESGGPVTSTFTGTRASLESANTETQDMSGGKTLVLQFENGNSQQIDWVNGDFAVPGAATAEEIVEAANKQITGGRFFTSSSGTKVSIESDVAGKGSRVTLVSGDAIAVWGWPTLAVGTGNVEDLSAVTVEEVKTIVEAAISGVRAYESDTNKLVLERTDAGSAKSINTPSGTARTKLGFDTTASSGVTGSPSTIGTMEGLTEGVYARDIKVLIEDATNGESDNFNLTLTEFGVVQEFFPNLTMGEYNGTDTPDETNYIVEKFNDERFGSNILFFTDSLFVGSALERRPANGEYTLSGGDNGLTGLVDADYLGSEAGQNGLHSLDTESDVSILAIPGRATSSVHNGMLTYAQTFRKGRMIAVLDPPSGQTYQQVKTYVRDTASLKNSSEYGAFYWPELKIPNPDTDTFGNDETITIPPSGPVVGAYIRTDNARLGGIYDAPAGIEKGLLSGVVGVADTDVNREAVRDVIYPENINPIHAPTGQPLHIDGSRVLKRTGNFPSVPERRGVIFIEYSLVDGLAFVKHKSNTADLREEVDRTTFNFLLDQMELGAFASKDPDTAFFVDTGDALNPPSEQFAGRLNQRIGLATGKPTEFVNLLVSQDTRALEAEIQSAS